MAAWLYGHGMSREQRAAKRRREQLQYADDLYQSQIRRENIKNLRLQNAALTSSIRAMGGSVPGQSSAISTTRTQSAGPTWAEQKARFPTPRPTAQSAGGGGSFPSLAEIQSMITSSQQKAQEDFTSKIDLLKTQEQQKQEEEQLSARNAANRVQSYQRQSAIGAWESALRGR